MSATTKTITVINCDLCGDEIHMDDLSHDDTADALADAYFAGRPRRGRKLNPAVRAVPVTWATQADALVADALVTSLQLADLAAGREPVESAVIREVRRRREEMAAAEVRAGRRGTP